jgi:hypothetical protein
MLYVRFRYRRTRFTSLAQVNQALATCVEAINNRSHTRFAVSRLPIGELECADWKDATLHPDCYVCIESDYNSAPNISIVIRSCGSRSLKTKWRSS